MIFSVLNGDYADRRWCLHPFCVACQGGGLQGLSSFQYRWEKMLRCDLEGTIRFADAIMREDDLFYGTFFLENQGKAISPHFAFWWDPCSDELRPLNLHGMRLNAMSVDGT